MLALMARISLRHIESLDYTMYLKPWIDHLHQTGLAGLADDFSNYNAPYLILLWMASLMPFSDLFSIKLLSICFDAVLAIIIFSIVRQYRPKGYLPYIASLAVLFTPTVLLNSSAWGQCDSIYTSFLALSFLMYLKKRGELMWVFWAVALAFKFQAIFFLPFLAYTIVQSKLSLRAVIYAAATFVVLSLPPVFFGKGIIETFSVYVGQASSVPTNQQLALNIANLYQWLPTNYYSPIKSMGVFIGIAAMVAVVCIGLLRKFNRQTGILIVTLCLLVLPFVLPSMHERYLFPAEVFLITGAFIYPKIAPLAIALQCVTLLTYLRYFEDNAQASAVPYVVLSAVVLWVIYRLSVITYDRSKPLTP